jgi:putative two-component system response regulator
VTTPSADDQPTCVLVVDDEEPLRTALARFLAKRGYKALTAESGAEALAMIESHQPSLMLLDIRMPGMSGIDVVPEALTIDPDLAIVMLSAVADATSAAVCMQRGALDYLTKPIELSDLDRAVTRALKRRDTLFQEREIASWLKEEVARRTAEVERGRRRQEEVTVATLEALVNALEAKNPYLAGHSARVAAVSATIASVLKLPDDDVEHIRIAGRLHDLGMIGIREAVCDKQGPLNDAEYEHIKEHVAIGSRILAPLTHLGPVVDYVRSHHERWDGSGYPDHLQGEAIPIGARVIGAAEVYDALTTSRPYQEKLAPEEAVDRMRLLTGKVIDPRVMDALAAAVSARQTLVFLDDDQSPVT